MNLRCILPFLLASFSAGAFVFNRVATFNICTQIDPTCNTDTEAVAEIVDASPDGNTLLYTDGVAGNIGLVDISDPSNPVGLGTIDVGGEPTSVAVTGDGLYAVAAVNTSPDFVNVTGNLIVIDIESQLIVATLPLPGQPDSLKVSPDNQFIAIAIENERDEDLGDGAPPQMPPGSLVVVDKSDTDPTMWSTTLVNLTGLDGLRFPEDPEPEFVDISTDNVCVITLQENNGIVILDLASLSVLTSFSAGAVAEITQIDATEDDMISQTESLNDILREPDSAVFIGTDYFATADEGDLDGGSRGFTIFGLDGTVVYESGNFLEHASARYGHYPEGRSENKGNEPEGMTYSTFGDENLLFVLSERANTVYVFNVDPTDPSNVSFKQVLPSGVGPEGVTAIPSRNLLAVASEVDDRGAAIRSSITIYEYAEGTAAYPTLVSNNRADGTPIPFSALSGLAAADAPGIGGQAGILYSVDDSFYSKSRIFTIDVTSFPYAITNEMRVMDSDGVLAAAFPNSTLVNDDMTVNLDQEGIAVSREGGYWIANEGAGTVGDIENPVTTANFVVKVSTEGVIETVVTLPEEIDAIQVRFGFEGIAEYGDFIVVAFQRAWGEEANPRLGIYDTTSSTWKFVFYPLDTPSSQNGGWVGIGDLSPVGNGDFVVLERDNQGGPDAAIKKIYKISLGSMLEVEESTTVEKTLVRDVLPDLAASNGNIYEKLEGLAVTSEGEVWINNDNDGVDDNSGEQQLISLGMIVTIPEGTATPIEDSPTVSPVQGTSMANRVGHGGALLVFGFFALL